MKELSIKEKAQRYDEAIEIARKFATDLPNGRNDRLYHVWDLESIFPELKESEDAMIIRELTSLFKDGIKGIDHPYTGEDCERWLAWLEKQGEQKSNKCIYSNDNYTDEDKLILCGDCKEDCKLNKVEPKFNICDWVIDKQGIVHQIANVVENVTNHTYSYDIVGGGYFNDNTEGVRLWTIQDAKNGDVLVNWNNTVFIFKAIEDETVKFHIAYNGEKWDAVKTPSTKLSHLGLPEPQFEFHLATKEQRDFLFKKMKEAGYEWDAEKKELLKIEQKQVINYPDNLPKDNWELIHEFVNKFGRIPKDEDELNVLIEYVLKRQNPAWSEEDEKIRKALFEYFTTSDNNAYYEVCGVATKKILVWLDKQREQKSTWSEEDKELLNDIIVDVEVLKEQDRTKEGKAAYKREIDWLKSLEDRATTKARVE